MQEKGFMELKRRMEVFLLLYIDGASFVIEEEEYWKYFVIYQVCKVLLSVALFKLT